MNDNRILFFCKFPPPYHGQTICTRKIYEIVSGNNSFQVSSIDTSYGERRPDHVNLRYILFNMIYSFKLVGLYSRLLIRSIQYSPSTVYIVLSPSYLGILKNSVSIFIARLFGCRLIAHIHNQSLTRNLKHRLLYRAFFRKIDNSISIYISISKRITEQLSDYTTSDKIRTIYNTIDDEIVITEDEIEKKIDYKSASKNYTFLFLSNIIEEKGILYLLEAFSKLTEISKNQVKLHLVGGCNNPKLARTINTYSENYSNINLEGPVYNRSKIRQILLESDVFVLPTYYENEALPISIIESLNAATPVITTDHASITELIEDDTNGFIVQKKSSEDLAEKMKLLLNRDIWKRMAIEARKFYMLRFNQETFEEKILDAFKLK